MALEGFLKVYKGYEFFSGVLGCSEPFSSVMIGF